MQTTADFIYAEPMDDQSYIEDDFDTTHECTSPEPPPLPERNPTRTNTTIEDSRSPPCITKSEASSVVESIRNSPRLSSRLTNNVYNKQRNPSLRDIQTLDFFALKPPRFTSDGESFILETDQYVRQIKRRRGQILSQIDTNAGDRLRRKVGYEIERRLIKAMTIRRKRSHKGKKSHNGQKVTFLTLGTYFRKNKRKNLDESRRRRERQRRRLRRNYGYGYSDRHHRFCAKCVTASFKALFNLALHPMRSGNSSSANTPNPQMRPDSKQSLSDARIPTPKMLLNLKDGRIQWPVFQYGGPSGAGMIINTEEMFINNLRDSRSEHGRKSSKRHNNRYTTRSNLSRNHHIGRENFSLQPVDETGILNDVNSNNNNNTNLNSNNFSNNPLDDEEKGLVGWLQIRDEKRHRRRFVPVVNPAPEGPFRKAPWLGGNFHVMKF